VPVSATKWSNHELVEALRLVPGNTDEAKLWWAGAEGAGLLAQIADHMAMPVVSSVRRELSVEIDADEVRSTAWLLLSPERPVLMKHLLSGDTDSAWAYLFTSVKNQVLDDVGRFFRRELSDDQVLVAGGMEDDQWHSLDEVVHQTVQVLQPYTPRALHSGLVPAVAWMADMAVHGRLSHLPTTAGRSDELAGLGFGGQRARTLANVTVGARPDHAATSLFAGFLLHPEWDPRYSPRHAAAIREYAKRMSASADVARSAA
jgi:hypothetical protein